MAEPWNLKKLMSFAPSTEDQKETLEKLKAAHPTLKDVDLAKLDGPTRAFVTETLLKNRVESGEILYEERIDSLGRKVFVPQGDSGTWIARHTSAGYRGRFAPLKFIEGKPYLASAVKKKVTYEVGGGDGDE